MTTHSNADVREDTSLCSQADPDSDTRGKVDTPPTPLQRVRCALMTIVWFAAMAWLMLPASLGGDVRFVVVQGTSMEPTYHSGDLLYVRAVDSYRPGDIAVYRMPAGEPGGGDTIVHRIRALADGRYEFQGDNRTTPDVHRPTAAQILGRPILNLGPHPTRGLMILPLALSAVLGVIVGACCWPSRTADEDSGAGTSADRGAGRGAGAGTGAGRRAGAGAGAG